MLASMVLCCNMLLCPFPDNSAIDNLVLKAVATNQGILYRGKHSVECYLEANIRLKLTFDITKPACGRRISLRYRTSINTSQMLRIV